MKETEIVSTESSDTKKALLAVRKAEKRIKELIILSLISLVSLKYIDDEIKKAITDMKDELPPSSDYPSLANGLWRMALEGGRFTSSVKSEVDSLRTRFPEMPKTVSKAVEYIEKKIPNALATAEMKSLPKRVKDGVEVFASGEPQADSPKMARPLSEWAAAETQVRHDYQKKKIDEVLSKGGDLFRISVHRNCSERCFPDQGKVVSKSLPSIDSDLWTGQKTSHGEKIYSYQAMVARTDKYGYNNFILTGFNCRHFLEPFEDGKPEKPTKIQAEEVSEAEEKMRYMERRLRAIHSKWKALEKIDRAKSEGYHQMFIKGVREYEAFANKWGIEPQEWRTL